MKRASSGMTLETQKARALELILETWDRALAEGIEPDLLASSAIFAALTDMVDLHGEEPVAQMCKGLPDRILAREFTLKD